MTVIAGRESYTLGSTGRLKKTKQTKKILDLGCLSPRGDNGPAFMTKVSLNLARVLSAN